MVAYGFGTVPWYAQGAFEHFKRSYAGTPLGRGTAGGSVYQDRGWQQPLTLRLFTWCTELDRTWTLVSADVTCRHMTRDAQHTHLQRTTYSYSPTYVPHRTFTPRALPHFGAHFCAHTWRFWFAQARDVTLLPAPLPPLPPLPFSPPLPCAAMPSCNHAAICHHL